jgi:hypothetical protein
MQDRARKCSFVDGNPTISDEPRSEGLCLEHHFSIEEIAELWNLSKDAVRKIFRDVPGVLVIGANNPQRGKRRYTTLRIPQSVLEKVHLQYSFGNHVLIRYHTEPK